MDEGHKPLLLTVREVARLLRIHRPKVYELIRDHTIEGFKIGSDWRVKRASVEVLIGEIPPDFFDGTIEDDDDRIPSGVLGRQHTSG